MILEVSMVYIRLSSPRDITSKVGCPAATLGPRVPCTIRITEGWGVALFVFVTMDKTELFPQDVLDLEPALKVAGQGSTSSTTTETVTMATTA